MIVFSYVADVRHSSYITSTEEFATFADLVGMFTAPDAFEPANSKDALPLLVPAQFGGRRRISSNVLHLHALILDFDRGSFEELAGAQRRIEPYGHVFYTSFSHSPEQHKFRAIVRLSRPVEGTEWLKFWPRAVHELGASAFVDSKCADAPHMYFVPGGDRAKYKVSGSDGLALDVDSVLTKPLPPGSVEAYDAALSEPIPEDQRGEVTESLRDFWDARLQNLCAEIQKRPYPGTIYDLVNGKVFGVARGIPHILTEDRTRAMVRHALHSRYARHLDSPSVEVDEARALERVEKAIEDGKHQCWWPARSDEQDCHPFTELGLCERFIDRHHKDLAYEPTLAKWIVWNSKFWEATHGASLVQERMFTTVRSVVDETDALAADLLTAKDALEMAEKDPNIAAATKLRLSIDYDFKMKRIEEITKFAIASESNSKIQSGILLANSSPLVVRSRSTFDRNLYDLNFENGTLDLKTCKLRPHRREDMCTRIVPHAYDKNAQCPLILRTLDEMMLGNAELVQYLIKLFAYSALGVRTEQMFVICIGDGANGKSTLMKLLFEMFGRDYGFSANGENLMTNRGGSRHETWRKSLEGKRLVVVQEVDEGRNFNESLIKELTGGDPITGRKLYENESTFIPELCLWLSTNHLPHVRNVDEGIWRRPRLIPFKADFRENPDKLLPQKLVREAAGFWALVAREACKLVLDPDSLQEPREVREATRQYRVDEDPLQGFVEAWFDLSDPQALAPRGVVWGAYLEHHQSSPPAERVFHTQKFFYAALEKRFKAHKRDGARGFLGLRLLNPTERHVRSPRGQLLAAQTEATKKNNKPN